MMTKSRSTRKAGKMRNEGLELEVLTRYEHFSGGDEVLDGFARCCGAEHEAI